jgi:hypothetical protein
MSIRKWYRIFHLDEDGNTLTESYIMARRAHCPYCDPQDGSIHIVELPHSCPEHQQYLATLPPEEVRTIEGRRFHGPRDDEGRPVGEAVTSGKRVPPKFKKPETDNS